MPWIQNCSLSDIEKAWHYDPGENNLLIQIVDPDMEFPTPKYPFQRIKQYKFLDIEESVPGAIHYSQAKQIAQELQNALNNNTNVIVHCVAGICRSGAVVEAGVSIGFQDTELYRSPNTRVKTMIMAVLHHRTYPL